MATVDDIANWDSKAGIYKAKDGGAITNPRATLEVGNNDDIIRHYVTYLKMAKSEGANGEYNWANYNARKLVWEMGNERKLPSIRNAVYKFCSLLNVSMDTLRTGPRLPVMTTVQKKQKALALWKELDCDDYVKEEG